MKADMSRDYYGDLELSPTADVNEIKKQFRKLALKYHPDRNPGREIEVNSKFLTIQSAHEILTNPEQKAKYDTHRNRTASRYPTASGVKGNPWQDVGNQYPPPPRRPPMPTRPSAASRYTSWATPNQKSPREDANTAERMRAWDRMRPGSSRPGQNPAGASSANHPTSARKPTRPMDPPPPPPRTEAQRKKAEASFGTRRTNFTQNVPDEPPAPSAHYYTAKQRPSVFAETAAQNNANSDYIDPLSKQFQETFVDGRQRTPYSAHSGEKFNPFDGTNINRGRSVRDNLRNAQNSGTGSQPPSPPPRRRSASVPDEADQPGRSPFSRAGDRYTPRGSPNSGTAGKSNAPENGSSSSTANHGPTVYDYPFSYLSSSSLPRTTIHPKKLAQNLHSEARANKGKTSRDNVRVFGSLFHNVGLSPDVREVLAKVYPSGSAQANLKDVESVEAKQRRQLQELLNYKNQFLNCKKRPHHLAHPSPDSASDEPSPAKKHADPNGTSSFGFTVDDDTFTPTKEQQRFMRKSADSINTRFVADDFAGSDWKFNAGGPDEDAFLAAKRRAQKDARRSRASPKKNGLNANPESASDPQPSSQGQTQSGFNPQEWAEQIKPDAFMPQPPRGMSASPTKFNRPIKKPKPVRMTAGTAGLVDEDESSSSEEKTRPGTAAGHTDNSTPPTTDSPVAMDIDTPPPEAEVPTLQPKVARNIPVEPTKPEWRAGIGTAAPKRVTVESLANPNSMGSEDTEGFLFSDFKNVAPFAPQSSGLGSLGDLKSSLPFESKAAPSLSVDKETSKPLPFPVQPKSPRPPPVLAVSNLKPSHDSWSKYVHDFHNYMEQWADFNARVTDHFVARKNLISESRKLTGFNWVEARGDAGIRKYLQWLEEDKIVRQRWMVACEAHELRVREFLKYREKMLQ